MSVGLLLERRPILHEHRIGMLASIQLRQHWQDEPGAPQLCSQLHMMLLCALAGHPRTRGCGTVVASRAVQSVAAVPVAVPVPAVAVPVAVPVPAVALACRV